MQGFQVDTVWRPDRQPGDQTDAWEEAEDAIELSGCNDPGLDSGDVAPGLTIPLGNASITMVCGFTEPPAPWQLSNPGEIRNAGSIVVRLDFQGRSVLFCGDTVGRHTGQPNDACIAAELFMVTNSAQVPLRSDVIIAPHHGADNGSSTPFIAEVNPTYVVFSAGHHGTYRHPRASAALRYLSHGVPAERMLRTDLGDDDGPDEWDHGRIEGHRDLKGDDDVEIVIREDGTLLIAYQNPANPPIDGLHFGPLAESQMMDESPTAAPDVPTRALASDVEAVCAPTPTVYCGAQSSHACGKCYKSTRRLFRLRSCRDSRCR